MDRRRFLKTAAAGTLMTSLSQKFAHAVDSPLPTRTWVAPVKSFYRRAGRLPHRHAVG